MYYRIIATRDIIGKDDIYLSDATTESLSDEITESLEACTKRLHEIVNEGKANSIEVIYPDANQGNYHVSFYAPEHPFAEVEYIFDEIDEWAENRQHASHPTLSNDEQRVMLQEDGSDLPF